MVKCFYEVLEVSPHATDDEIKKAYRQLALRFHPDKNPTNLEDAQAQFLLVQEAYETLSDPNERAWYDSHKTQILSGLVTNEERDEDAGPVDPLIERLNLFRLFRKDCFNGFSEETDNLPGRPFCFYTTYRRVFEEVASEENLNRQRFTSNAFKKREQAKAPGVQEQSTLFTAPTFGTSKSDTGTVSAFYRYWTQFTSERDYGFADKWHLNAAPNRAVRRQIETENKVARAEARKEFQNTVRSLANWLRKRDPRVLQHAAEKKAAEALRRVPLEAKALRQRAQAAERARHLQRERELQRWRELENEKRRLAKETGQVFIETDTDDLQSANEGDGSDTEASCGDDTATTTPVFETPLPVPNMGLSNPKKTSKRSTNCILFCEACRKTFRSEAQFQTHASSKKHRKAVEQYLAKQGQQKKLHDVARLKNIKSPTVADGDDADEEEESGISAPDDSEQSCCTSNNQRKSLGCSLPNTLESVNSYVPSVQAVDSNKTHNTTSDETSSLTSADELGDVIENEDHSSHVTPKQERKNREDERGCEGAVQPELNRARIASPGSLTPASDDSEVQSCSSAAASESSGTEDSETELLYRMRHLTLGRARLRRTGAVSEEDDDTNTSSNEDEETRHPNSLPQEESTLQAALHRRRLQRKQIVSGPQRRRRRRAAVETSVALSLNAFVHPSRAKFVPNSFKRATSSFSTSDPQVTQL